MLCETKRTVRPEAPMSSILPRHRRWNSESPTARTSSTRRISGSRCAATENASRTYMPLEYRLTGVSMNFSTPAKSMISGSFSPISRRFMPRIEPFRKMFSRPVSSGWKPVPTSSRLPTRPRISARPAVGEVIRVRIFSSVDLPAPFRPITPTTSPSATSKDTSLRAQSSGSSWCSRWRCVARRAATAIESRRVPYAARYCPSR